MNRQGKYSSRLLKDFEVVNILGKGAYGAVVQVVNCLDRKGYAVKVVAGDTGDALREVENLVQIPLHQNVVHYYTCWEDKLTDLELKVLTQKLKLGPGNDYFSIPDDEKELDVLCIQMELCGEDLRKWMGKQTVVNEGAVVNIFIQIAKGLEHIHKHDIIHRDLKPENIFLGYKDSTIVSIGDLGIATPHLALNSALHTKKMGTPLYLAPEQASNRYGKPADIYALGLILFELLNPKIQPSANGNSYHALCQSFIDLKFNGTVPSHISSRWPRISQLILKMLNTNPKERPTFKEIFEAFAGPKTQTRTKSKSNTTSTASSNTSNQSNQKPAAANQHQHHSIDPMKTNKVETRKPSPSASSHLNICSKCNKEIIGAVTTALGKKWHPEHFQCAHCNKPIDKPFYNMNDKAYCDEGYHLLFGKKCHHCNQIIRTKSITALGKTWHAEHFMCTKCRAPFKGDSFYSKDNNPYCHKDYLELFAPKCASCKKPISGSHTTASGLSWHNECFVCSVCKQSVKGGYHMSNNKLYCSTHVSQ